MRLQHNWNTVLMTFVFCARRLLGSLIQTSITASMRISRAEAYEQMHSEGFPLIRIGKRMLAPRDQFLEWVEDQVGR